MDKNALILLIQENSSNEEYLRRILENGEGRLRVQSIESLATAVARIAGGGVDLVILDLSLSQKTEIEKLDSFLKLRAKAAQVPLVVVYDSEDDSLLLRSVRAGDVHYLLRARCDTDLNPLVHSAIGKRLVQLDPRPLLVPKPRKAGAVSTFLGSKGGVGTTTVALNVASALAPWGKVILAELRPTFGTLSPYFHLRHLTGTLTHLLRADPGRITPVEIEAVLWPCKSIPGLNILFGPQTIEQCGEAAAPRCKAILKALAMLADYVVVDLPASLSEANRAVMQDSDRLVLVVERDPLCIESARPILETIRAWDDMPQSIGSVIVNRAAVAVPMDLSEIEMKLAIPTLAVIPPATDLCIAAQKAGEPLTLFDGDSLAARSLISLAEALTARTRTPARAS